MEKMILVREIAQVLLESTSISSSGYVLYCILSTVLSSSGHDIILSLISQWSPELMRVGLMKWWWKGFFISHKIRIWCDNRRFIRPVPVGKKSFQGIKQIISRMIYHTKFINRIYLKFDDVACFQPIRYNILCLTNVNNFSKNKH